MNDLREARFRGIQQKLAENLSNEDAEFLESYLAEASEEQPYEEDYIDDPALMEGDEYYDDDPEIFEDEEGNVFADLGEEDEEGNPLFMSEDGEVFAMGDDEPAYDEGDYYEEPDYDEYEEAPQYMESYQDDEYDDDASIQEVANRFPALANEIDAEEMYAMESDRDPDIVSLKLENKLLKSRMIAENKLAESGLGGIIPMAELVGKAPDEMDTIIESRARMLDAVAGLVESSAPVGIDTSYIRENEDGLVGIRILRNSLLPS